MTTEENNNLSSNLLALVREAKSQHRKLHVYEDAEYGTTLLDWLENLATTEFSKFAPLLLFVDKMESPAMKTMPEVVKVSAWVLLALLIKEGLPLPSIFCLCSDTEEGAEEVDEDRWIDMRWPKHWIFAHLYHDGSWALLLKTRVMEFSASKSEHMMNSLVACLSCTGPEISHKQADQIQVVDGDPQNTPNISQ